MTDPKNKHEPGLVAVPLKTCTKCGGTFPRTEFRREPRIKRDGRYPWCFTCDRQQKRKYRYANHDKVLAYEKQNRATERRRAKNAEYQRACKEKYPERFRARKLLNQAIKRGEIIRPPCQKCGAPKPHAHHHDYSKPYDVEWLCSTCHYAEHRTSPEGIAARGGAP